MSITPGAHDSEFDPSTMAISPEPFRQVYHLNSASEHFAKVTPPCSSHSRSRGSMAEKWMARSMRRAREIDGSRNVNDHISPLVRAEVSKQVYGILRDNIPPPLEAQTSHNELTLIADSIESKLYQTASSSRAYCSAYSTLEFRITALATAVLIHSDQNQHEHEDHHHNNGHQGISGTCARLSAAARNSLVYCVMVLVSYEKKNLDSSIQRTKRRRISRMEKNSWHSAQGQIGGRSSAAMMEEMYPPSSQPAVESRCRFPQLEKHHNSVKAGLVDCRPQFENTTYCASVDESTRNGSDNRVNVQIIAGDSKTVDM